MLATMLQQWARRYQRLAFPHYRPQRQALIHTFYNHGIKNWHIQGAAEALPLLLHTSLFVFFAGLSVFLYGINRTVFKVVTTWISLCIFLYACLSIFPIARKNSPYNTPLSGIISLFFTGIRYLFFLRFPGFRKYWQCNPGAAQVHRDDHYFSRSMNETAENYAIEQKPEIDSDISELLWSTFLSLDNEADIEKFFEGLPSLCDRDTDPLTGGKMALKQKFIEPHKAHLKAALIRFTDRTLMSHLVEGIVKHRRMAIFTKTMESDSTNLLGHSNILRRVLFEDWDGLLGCMEFGLSMRNWANSFDTVTVESFYAQCVAALTISDSIMRKRLGHELHGWVQLVKNLPVSTPSQTPVIRENDDDILLANVIFIVRITVQTYAGSVDRDRGHILDASPRTLRALCQLDITKALPELQHEFCDLWNKLVITLQYDKLPHHRTIAKIMLRNIRKLYIALHSEHQTPFNVADELDHILENTRFYLECTEELHSSSAVTFPRLEFNTPPTQPVAYAPEIPDPYILPRSDTSLTGQPSAPKFPNPAAYLPRHAGNSSFAPPPPLAQGLPDPHPDVPPPAVNSSSVPPLPPAQGLPVPHPNVPRPAGSSSSAPPPPAQGLPDPRPYVPRPAGNSSSAPPLPPAQGLPDPHPYVPPPAGKSSSAPPLPPAEGLPVPHPNVPRPAGNSSSAPPLPPAQGLPDPHPHAAPAGN